MNPSFAPLSLKITAQRFGQIISRIWSRLTEPASSIQEPERRRQAQFLASLLLVVLLLATILTPLAAHLINPTQPFWQEMTFQIAVITDIFLIIAYRLSRTRHYHGAAMLALGIMIIAIFTSAIPERSWTEVLLFDYLLIVILMSSVFFSIPTTLMIVIACIMGMLLFPTFVPTAPFDEIVIGPLNFILINSALIFLMTHHRNLLERDRQAALAKSESKYRLLLEQAADGISVADRKGNYIEVNSTLCQMLGYPREEFLQLNVRDIIPPEDLASAPLRFDELYARKLILTERRLRCKDGTLLPVEISAKMLDDGRLQAIVRDIGERKQVEEALRESQTFLEKAQEVGHIGSWKSEMAMEGALTWSKEIYRIFGIAEDQFDGKVETFFNYIYPDDLEAVKAASQAAFANDVPYNIEHRIVRSDGSVRWVHERADVLRDETGAPLRMIGIIQDITERKQTEKEIRQLNEELEQRVIERTAQLAATNKVLENEVAERKQAENTLAEERNLLRTLIDNLPDYIYVKDTESRFMTNNMAHMHLMGATRLGEIVGKTDFDLFPAKLATQYYADDQAVIQSGQPLVNREEHTISETDDSLKWVSTTKVPLWDSQGKVIGLVGITRDISQRKRAEEAIKQLNEDLNQRAIQLEAANKELEAFSYSVSHDLRAPLRAIDGFSQALLEDYAEQLDEAGQDHLRRVRAATQRMGQLIDDMLNLSRITRSELRRQQVNLSALATMIAGELRQTQLERQVEFVIAPGLIAESDPQLLRMALENLLSNAWKFTQKQPQATIEFGVTQHQGQLTYFVRDDGVGFDMTYVDKLFGPFQRLHARNEFEGTGIGLATVQRIIQRHGGRVWAEATVGKGATFFFTLL